MNNSQDQLLDLQALVKELNLTGVHFYEYSASIDTSRAKVEAEPGERVPADNAWGVRMRHHENELGVRFRLEVELEQVDVVVDISLEYEAAGPFSVTKTTIYDFVNNVSIMQAFPYFREAVFSITGRVGGQSYVLPIVQRGEVIFELAEGGPEISGRGLASGEIK